MEGFDIFKPKVVVFKVKVAEGTPESILGCFQKSCRVLSLAFVLIICIAIFIYFFL